jgi:Na+/H+ antiporter NhaD/arsenite permease-like protein
LFHPDLRFWLTRGGAALSLVLMLTKPRGWNEAWWTAGGGALMLLFRLETPRQAWHIVRTGQGALLFLLALLLFSALLERSGFFEWSSIQTAPSRTATGDGFTAMAFCWGH